MALPRVTRYVGSASSPWAAFRVSVGCAHAPRDMGQDRRFVPFNLERLSGQCPTSYGNRCTGCAPIAGSSLLSIE